MSKEEEVQEGDEVVVGVVVEEVEEVEEEGREGAGGDVDCRSVSELLRLR